MRLYWLNLACDLGGILLLVFASVYVFKCPYFFIPSLVYLQKRHWSIGINNKKETLKEVCLLKSLEVLHYPCNEEMDKEAN